MSLSSNSHFTYCQACGESVETHRVVHDGALQHRCIYCGLVLDTGSADAETCERAMVVEDSRTLCDALTDLVVERELSLEAAACHNGREFVVEYTQSLIARRPPGFVLLDIEMPILDGVHTCIVARAIESGFGVPPVPIIFFSGHKCDENLRKVLKASAPAAYLNKASVPNIEMIGDRLSAIIRQVTAKGA